MKAKNYKVLGLFYLKFKTYNMSKFNKLNQPVQIACTTSSLAVRRSSDNRVRSVSGFVLRSDEAVRKSQIKGYKYILP